MASDREIKDRYIEALGDCKAACLRLARNADPDVVQLKGGDYKTITQSLKELEGCCRQLAQPRSDARWVRLGVTFWSALKRVEHHYARRDWLWFGKLVEFFDVCGRRFDELDRATGVLSSRPILPIRPSDWLILPKQM